MRIYLDANSFIRAVEGNDRFSEQCRTLLSMGDARPELLVTSELTLAEVLVHPFQEIDLLQANAKERPSLSAFPSSLAAVYGDLIGASANIEVIAVGRQLLIGAAWVRATAPYFKLPDAIHLASARMSACTIIITGDNKFSRPTGFQLERVDVNESALELLLERLSDLNG